LDEPWERRVRTQRLQNGLAERGAEGGTAGVAKSWVPCAANLPRPPVVFAPFSHKLGFSLLVLVLLGG